MDLPLDLMGRADTLKMIYLPKLLYVLANLPCKVPKSIFKQIDTICTVFLWNGRSPRVALATWLLAYLAGLVSPNFYLYYLASQLVHIHDWLHLVAANACNPLRELSHPLETLHNILYRGRVPARPGTSMQSTSLSLFKIIDSKISKEPWSASPNNALWFNPNLKELCFIPDPQCWYFKGVKYLCLLYDMQGFKAFQRMRVNFDTRSYMFFYYQLRHAIRAQFGSLENPVIIPQLEKILWHPDPTKLISTYYAAFMTDCNPRFRVA